MRSTMRSFIVLVGTSAAALSPCYPATYSSVPIDRRSAQEVIQQLNLIPNDEKGYYIETFEDTYKINNRSASTAIYHLLEGSVGPSIWHRVDAVEIWHYYAGAPLTLSLSYDDGQPVVEKLLGPDVFHGQQPQVVIAKEQWQSARSHGNWTLVGTTVAPGFIPSGVELADPSWTPNGA
ncbi:RmlC-like cupin domain-containing protein [Xylariaceae sp. FL0016]|nr:RmlC-like cupin domain-containing protein [Xylariaceae sp. FL0016]